MFRHRFSDYLTVYGDFNLKTGVKVRKQLLYDLPHEWMLNQVQLFPVKMGFDLITSNSSDGINVWKNGQLVKNIEPKSTPNRFSLNKDKSLIAVGRRSKAY